MADEVGESLDRLVAEATAGERVHTRTLRQSAEEEATFAGVLVDIAERGDAIVARTIQGRSHRGIVEGIGRDFAVVRDGVRPPVLLAIDALASVRPQPSHPATDTAGARPSPLGVTLAGLLAGLAPERPRVQLYTTGDTQAISGQLRAVGEDVTTVALDGEGRGVVHVRTAAIAEVLVLG